MQEVYKICEVNSQFCKTIISKYYTFSWSACKNYKFKKFSVTFMNLVKWLADAHFASKNTSLKRNTMHCYILLKRTVCFKLACYSLLFNTLYPSTHFASWNVFLLGTLCSPTPFASKNPFLLNTVCFSTPFAPQNTLLLNTLCSSAHCAP